MKKSEPILPLPIYDDLFDQQRFNSLCDPDCQQQLIFATSELPFFQFLRDKSLKTATQLYLRNACRDKEVSFYKLVPENITNYEGNFKDYFTNYPRIGGIFDDGVNPPFGGLEPIAEIDCGTLKSIELSPYWSVVSPAKLVITNVFPGIKVYFKIIVDNFFRTGTFAIKIFSGEETDTLIGTITQSGIFNFELTSDITNQKITIYFEDYASGDSFTISHIQAGYINPLDLQLFLDDVPMDETKIKIKQLRTGKDVVTYCEGQIDYAPEPGDYYYILNMDGQIYFSEVFTLKTPKELEKYFNLLWFNSCDINETIIYNIGAFLCGFKHSLYFDAALFGPEYPTIDDGIENGVGDRINTFKRWQKNVKLDILKSPQFLTDALSAVFIHDNVYLKNPLNDKKESPNSFYKILSITNEISDILLNCYQSVKLKLVLTERYTNKLCCDNILFFDCTPVQAPTIDNTSEPLSGVYLLEGTILPQTFAVIEYDLNGAGYIEANNVSVGDLGSYEILFDTNGLGSITDLKVRVRSKTLDCDKGVSNVVDLI